VNVSMTHVPCCLRALQCTGKQQAARNARSDDPRWKYGSWANLEKRDLVTHVLDLSHHGSWRHKKTEAAVGRCGYGDM
jgi:hypothetical protein